MTTDRKSAFYRTCKMQRKGGHFANKVSRSGSAELQKLSSLYNEKPFRFLWSKHLTDKQNYMNREKLELLEVL